MYSEYKVHRLLTPFVKKLWTLDNLHNPQQVTNKSVLPNGCFNIAFVEGSGLIVHNNLRVTNMANAAYFCGQATEAVDLVIHPHTKATMVQLHAWSPVHFSSLQMNLFNDAIVPMDQIDENFARKVALEAPTTPEAIERFILNYFRPNLKKNATTQLILISCQRMLNNNGDVVIQELCDEMGCSTRHLQKVFKTHIGLSPKQFQIIVKLRNAVDDIAYPDEEDISFTELALNNNFYDQAHFNRTFRHIVKTSPRKFEVLQCLLSLKQEEA